MQEELLKRIDALAQKLGTTAEHVYRVYVAQAGVEARMDLAIAVLFLAILCLLAVLIVKCREDENDIWVLPSCFAVIALVVVMSFSTAAVTEFLNPEYWALHHIADELKK